MNFKEIYLFLLCSTLSSIKAMNEYDIVSYKEYGDFPFKCTTYISSEDKLRMDLVNCQRENTKFLLYEQFVSN